MKSWKVNTRRARKNQLTQWLNSESGYRKRYHGKRKLRFNREWEFWNNKNWKKDRLLSLKKAKKQYDKDIKYLPTVKYVEDCNVRPCEVVGIHLDPVLHQITLDCKDLIKGTVGSCSWYHCGLVPLTEEDAFAMKDFIEKYGMTTHLVLNYMNRPGANIKDLITEIDSTPSGVTEEGWKHLRDKYGIEK